LSDAAQSVGTWSRYASRAQGAALLEAAEGDRVEPVLTLLDAVEQGEGSSHGRVNQPVGQIPDRWALP
jgi:hypothetical protein